MVLSEMRQVIKDSAKFIITKNDIRTWENYFLQYKKVFEILLKDSLNCKYQTNHKFMPFMFMFRHSMELWVKYIYSNNNNKDNSVVVLSHDISLFLQGQTNECISVLNELLSLQKDKDGACWRYPIDCNGLLYFNQLEKIDSYNACIKFFDFLCSIEPQYVAPNIENNYRKLQWELYFHPSECTTMGQVATQYDLVLNRIVTAINKNEVSINEIYLPVLFILRHTLELKLKQGIIDLDKIVNDNVRKQIGAEHSVKKLYDIFVSFIEDAIAKISDNNLKEECEKLRDLTVEYKDVINMLDAKSLTFRFPLDIKGHITNYVPSENDIVKTINLFVETDPFLCYVTQVLKYEGILEI